MAVADSLDDCRSNIEEMDVDQLVTWLEEQGIPKRFCEMFEENYIDGNEFCSLSEKDIRDMIKPIGIVKKILRLIPKKADAITRELDYSSVTVTRETKPLSLSPPIRFSPTSDIALNTSTPVVSDDDVSLTSAASFNSREFTVPNSWPPRIMDCIKLTSDRDRKRALTPSVRNEIVRVLASNMFCHNPNPNKDFCCKVAKMLVKKYKFMCDAGNNVSGYGSWEKKLIEKVHNIKNGRKRTLEEPECPPAKGKKGRPRLIFTRYPPVPDEDDDVACDRHMLELSRELKKNKPRKDVVLSLSSQTYRRRRAEILSDSEDVCATTLLAQYEELRKPYVLEQEIALILDKPGVFSSVLKDWDRMWIPAIIEYSRSRTGRKAKTFFELVKSETNDAKLALQILCLSFSGKGCSDMLSFIYEECDMNEDLAVIGENPPLRSAPRICLLTDAEDPQYFLFVERKPLFSVPTLSQAIIFWFSLYYVFNLEYCPQCKYICLFFQECVFGLPAASFLKQQKTSTYINLLNYNYRSARVST